MAEHPDWRFCPVCKRGTLTFKYDDGAKAAEQAEAAVLVLEDGV